jgi:tRNA nucleotidyltransferase (CCA-adding enzyme)
MVGVPQDPQWHPEGDVWTHTCLVVDAAAQLRAATPDGRLLMLAALLHDAGKPATTATVDGRVRACRHDVAGVGPAQDFLRHLKAPQVLVHQVGVLVRHHLAVAMLHANGASARAYRRLYRTLNAAHIDVRTLHHLSRADHLGRTSVVAQSGQHPAGDAFWRQITHLGLTERPAVDVVQGRHLIAAGQTPGPGFATLLHTCREIQDETGWRNPERIVTRALFPEDSTSPAERVRTTENCGRCIEHDG